MKRTCRMCLRFYSNLACNRAHFPDDAACGEFEKIRRQAKHLRLVRNEELMTSRQGVAAIYVDGGMLSYVRRTCIARFHTGGHYMSDKQMDRLLTFIGEAVEKFNEEKKARGEE